MYLPVRPSRALLVRPEESKVQWDIDNMLFLEEKDDKYCIIMILMTVFAVNIGS
jgi:hypothetical protein